MIHIGTQSVITPGTRVALSATRKQALWVLVEAIRPDAPGTANTGNIFLGDKTVTASNGYVMTPGTSQQYPATDAYIYNLAEIYIDAATASDGVRFTYGA